MAVTSAPISLFLVLATAFVWPALAGDPGSDGGDQVTIWGDEAVDLLYCVATECGGDLTKCYEDQKCRNLMGCTKKCAISDIECIFSNCKASSYEAMFTNRGLPIKHFANLTGCVVKKCPKPTQKNGESVEEARRRAEAAQDYVCAQTLEPVSMGMNTSSINIDNCRAKLTDYLNKVEATRDECPGEFDLIYSQLRNTLHYDPSKTRCIRWWTALKNRVNQVLLDKKTDAAIDSNPTREDQGETENCRNIYFNVGTPWEDSDGDTCAVYARHVCRDPAHPPVNTIKVSCESHDCKGTGGLYANQACCACGGGAAPGKEKRTAKIAAGFKKSKALIQNRCMLARCTGLLGECKAKEGCIKALGRVSNATCEIQYETIDECAAKYSTDITIDARAALKDVIECAGVQDQHCESTGSDDTGDSGTSGRGGGTDSGSSDGGSSSKAKKPVGVIVTVTLLGAALMGAGAFGGYMWYKKRSEEHSFRRVQINEDDGHAAMLDEPEL